MIYVTQWAADDAAILLLLARTRWFAFSLYAASIGRRGPRVACTLLSGQEGRFLAYAPGFQDAVQPHSTPSLFAIWQAARMPGWYFVFTSTEMRREHVLCRSIAQSDFAPLRGDDELARNGSAARVCDAPLEKLGAVCGDDSRWSKVPYRAGFGVTLRQIASRRSKAKGLSSHCLEPDEGFRRQFSVLNPGYCSQYLSVRVVFRVYEPGRRADRMAACGLLRRPAVANRCLCISLNVRASTGLQSSPRRLSGPIAAALTEKGEEI